MSVPVEKPYNSEYPAPITESNLPGTEVREAVPEFEENADIRDYMEIVFRHKWLVLTFLVCVVLTTLVVSLSMKPIYRGKGRLELNTRSSKVTKFEDINGLASQLQTKEFMQTQVKLLQSDSLARRVIAKLHLDETPEFNPAVSKEGQSFVARVKNKLVAVGKSVLGLGGKNDPALAKLSLQERIETKYSKDLTVQPDRDTTIISLSFNSTSPEIARDVVNSMIQEFISWEMDKRIDAAVTAKQQLEKQIEVARIQLEKAETNLNAYAQKAGIVSLDSKMNLVYSELEEINKALAGAEAERIGKEAVFKQAQKDNISSMPEVLERKLIQDLKQDHSKLQSEYQEMASTFKDDYPKLKNLKAKMDDVEKRINFEEGLILTSIKNEYQTALKREDALRKEADDKKSLALQLNDRATQYKILQREVESSKMIHMSLLERAKEIDANVGTELGKVQVVDYATLPLKPYKPNMSLNLALAAFIGLAGGIGLAFLLEFLDNTVKRIDEISDRFRMAVLGVLPLVKPEDIKDLDGMIRLKPKASFSESIRTAKVSIQLSTPMEQPVRSFLLTSTTAGEGKSTITSNIAQAFAFSEEKIIVIDADLRKPRLHKAFSNNGAGRKRKGLSNVLSGMCAVEDVIQETEVANLKFIPAGPVPPNPVELLASSRMRTMINHLLETYDRVIFDAPPASGFADILALGNHVDGVVLVSTMGQTHREALRIFRRSISNVRAQLLGCIVNKLDISYHYGGYYNKYYKYYHYYYHSHYGYGDNAPALTEGSEAKPKESDEAQV